VFAATRESGAWRINYEILGNGWPHLHGHVHPRYAWEATERITGPIWQYPKDVRNAPEHAYDDSRHGPIRAAVTAELGRVMNEAYTELGVDPPSAG
jgi:diadenosine tetraphosphate (Ap4A) HIT family hydrolase